MAIPMSIVKNMYDELILARNEKAKAESGFEKAEQNLKSATRKKADL